MTDALPDWLVIVCLCLYEEQQLSVLVVAVEVGGVVGSESDSMIGSVRLSWRRSLCCAFAVTPFDIC